MDAYRIVNTVTVMENPMSLHNYFGWPSVCRLPDGRLGAVASGFRRQHVCPWGKAVLSFSADEGRSWTLPAPVIDTILDDRDAGIVPLGGNRVMVTSFNNSLACQRMWNAQRRRDLGDPEKDQYPEAMLNAADAYLDEAEASGLEAEQLGSTYRISEDGCVTFGPLFRSPVSCPHGPCVTNDGRIIHVGHPFGDQLRPPKDPTLQCWELDGRGGAEYLSSIPTAQDEFGPFGELCEPHTLCLPSGRLLTHIRVQRGGEHKVFSTWQSESDDGGRSWSVPHPITGPLGGAPAHLLRLTNGDLISVVGDREPPFGIRVLRSRDEGETWEDRPLLMGMESYDLGYPASVQLKNGNVFTLWYRRAWPAANSCIQGAEWDPES